MTGPAYPRVEPPRIDSGADTLPASPFDVWSTIASQYANSPVLTGIIEGFSDNIDPSSLFADFYERVWNIDTAEGWGLDVWGRIVDVPRAITVAGAAEYFGFSEDPGSSGFGFGTFSVGTQITANYIMADGLYRNAILAKGLANITDGSIPALNRILRTLFPGRGNAYVKEIYPDTSYLGFSESADSSSFGFGTFFSDNIFQYSMAMQYVFDFDLTAAELSLVNSNIILPRPTGVTIDVNRSNPLLIAYAAGVI